MAQTKNLAYDNPAYQAVLAVPLFGTSTLAGGGLNATTVAGASTVSAKFVAFTNMLLKSITTTATTIGTGTATAFVLGNLGTGNALQVVRVTNNGTSGNVLATGTYQMVGAYSNPPGATLITTAGASINWSPQVPTAAYTTSINTSGASVNAQSSVNNWALVNGGIPLQAGDTVNIVKGVDATEVLANPMMELLIQPFANVTP